MTTIGCFIRLCLVTMPWIDARHLVGAAAGAGRHDELDRCVGSQALADDTESVSTPPTQTDAQRRKTCLIRRMLKSSR